MVDIDNINDYYDVVLKEARLKRIENPLFQFIKLDLADREDIKDFPTTGLRFFTVYGPWGRPDMAPYIFTKKIIDGETIDINNNGDMWRDFTYIDDIVEGVVRIADVVPVKNANWTVESGSPATSSAPYSVYNIGHGSPISLMDFVQAIEAELGIEAKKNFRGMQAGDVYQTYADTSDLFNVIGYTPAVTVKQGVAEFVKWYKAFYVK